MSAQRLSFVIISVAMLIQIDCHDSHPCARDYVLGVIFEEFLGLSWQRRPAAPGTTIIRLAGAGGEIRVPDHFFGHREDDWLTANALPVLPLATWDTRDLQIGIPLTDPRVPLVFGDAAAVARRCRDAIALPIDIFGSAFFMLSRYEEAVLPDRDGHDRFPARASVAYQAGFLDRPIVDEYVEILWAAMQQIWPGLQRKQRSPRTMVTCDVDTPFAICGAATTIARGFAGDLLKRHSPTLAWKNLRNRRQVRRGDYTNDPYRKNIEWIMDVNDEIGQRVSFYFIPESTHPSLDNAVSLNEPRMRRLLRHIHRRGHEIGVHPGYNTYRHPEALGQSVAILRRVLDEEGIHQPLLGGRQQFLRWETPTTARLWDHNGLDYDSTLCFADLPGFRCGTCHEYPLFDVVKGRTLQLRERPLVVMECSVIDERYLGLGYSDESLEVMQHYRRICHQFGGTFTLLWHNSHFFHQQDHEFYQALIV